jgi:hypothetical protein
MVYGCVGIKLQKSDHQEKIRVYVYVDKSSASVGQQIFITWSRLEHSDFAGFAKCYTASYYSTTSCSAVLTTTAAAAALELLAAAVAML